MEPLEVQAGERPGTCKHCGGRIYWATKGLKRVPVNVESGCSGQAPTATEGGQGTPHFAWCSARSGDLSVTDGRYPARAIPPGAGYNAGSRGGR
jgi:hypothetical protein